MCMCKHLCMGACPYLMPKINFTGVGLCPMRDVIGNGEKFCSMMWVKWKATLALLHKITLGLKHAKIAKLEM